jgi:predicted phosphohydrolase
LIYKIINSSGDNAMFRLFKRFSSTLQYISDIHLEYRSKIPAIKPRSNFLALCGDIGNPMESKYKTFLTNVSGDFDKVFLIAGNHEYWYGSRSAIKNRIMDTVSGLNNVHFLDQDEYRLDSGQVILGCTLWSKYRHVKHQKDVKWLMESLRNQNRDCIVLTHYLPSYQLIGPEYQTAEWLLYLDRYATDLEYLIRSPVKHWICGHSHCTMEKEINGVDCRINAVGYNGPMIQNFVKLS